MKDVSDQDLEHKFSMYLTLANSAMGYKKKEYN